MNVSLYYETLCNGCQSFVTTQLWKAYQTIRDIINITFVPYGNTKEKYHPITHQYSFTCQHGTDECLGNLIHVKLQLTNFYQQMSINS